MHNNVGEKLAKSDCVWGGFCLVGLFPGDYVGGGILPNALKISSVSISVTFSVFLFSNFFAVSCNGEKIRKSGLVILPLAYDLAIQ